MNNPPILNTSSNTPIASSPSFDCTNESVDESSISINNANLNESQECDVLENTSDKENANKFCDNLPSNTTKIEESNKISAQTAQEISTTINISSVANMCTDPSLVQICEVFEKCADQNKHRSVKIDSGKLSLSSTNSVDENMEVSLNKAELVYFNYYNFKYYYKICSAFFYFKFIIYYIIIIIYYICI